MLSHQPHTWGREELLIIICIFLGFKLETKCLICVREVSNFKHGYKCVAHVTKSFTILGCINKTILKSICKFRVLNTQLCK
jgi:hypothetical protein